MVENVYFSHFTSFKKRLGEMGEEGKPNLVAVSVFQSAAL